MSRLRQRLKVIEKEMQRNNKQFLLVSGLRQLYYDFRHDPPCYRELIDGKPGRIVSDEEIKREEKGALEREAAKHPEAKWALIVRINIDDSPLSERYD